MSEYIERDIVLQIAQISPSKQKLIERIKQTPTADVVPAIHAVHRGEEMVASFRAQICSHCGEYTPIGYYCYYCGAKMVGKVIAERNMKESEG